MESQETQLPAYEPVELDYQKFSQRLFSMDPPPEANSMSIVLQQENDDLQSAVPLLQYVLDQGMKTKHNLNIYQVHQLSQEEYNKMKHYFKAFGWDFDLYTVPSEKTVTDYNPDGTSFQKTIQANNRKVLFKPYKTT